MEKMLKKQYYKFTMYTLESYYSIEYFGVRELTVQEPQCNERTWVNQSNYKELFSFKFSDEHKLKKYLKKIYPNDFKVAFPTTIGVSIKGDTRYSAKSFVPVVSTATDEDYVKFQLKPPKAKQMFFRKKRGGKFQSSKNSYNYEGREIKKKLIAKFLDDINGII